MCYQCSVRDVLRCSCDEAMDISSARRLELSLRVFEDFCTVPAPGWSQELLRVAHVRGEDFMLHPKCQC